MVCLLDTVYICPAQILLEQHLIEVKLGKTADTRPSKIQTLVVLLLNFKKTSHFEPKESGENVVDVLKGMFQFSTGCRTVHCLLTCSACPNTHMYRTALNMKSRQDGNLYYSYSTYFTFLQIRAI